MAESCGLWQIVFCQLRAPTVQTTTERADSFFIICETTAKNGLYYTIDEPTSENIRWKIHIKIKKKRKYFSKCVKNIN